MVEVAETDVVEVVAIHVINLAVTPHTPTMAEAMMVQEATAEIETVIEIEVNKINGSGDFSPTES